MNWKLLTGWMCLFSLPFIWKGYLRSGQFTSRWGTLTHESALVAVMLFSLICIYFGYMAIIDTVKIIRQRKK